MTRTGSAVGIQMPSQPDGLPRWVQPNAGTAGRQQPSGSSLAHPSLVWAVGFVRTVSQERHCVVQSTCRCPRENTSERRRCSVGNRSVLHPAGHLRVIGDDGPGVHSDDDVCSGVNPVGHTVGIDAGVVLLRRGDAQ